MTFRAFLIGLVAGLVVGLTGCNKPHTHEIPSPIVYESPHVLFFKDGFYEIGFSTYVPGGWHGETLLVRNIRQEDVGKYFYLKMTKKPEWWEW